MSKYFYAHDRTQSSIYQDAEGFQLHSSPLLLKKPKHLPLDENIVYGITAIEQATSPLLSKAVDELLSTTSKAVSSSELFRC
ncbi:hypothetical protein J4Q44_G00145700 [Coregonus suidteri]|uniref:Uncharacterized protein n=1 Tax=Coregonus suidteri TaxID=861788 RepID=A0AAN8M1K2_9TELE